MTTKAKSPKPHRLEALRPLLDSMPKYAGEMFIGVSDHAPAEIAVCVSCGATDDRIMIRKHKKRCTYLAHWAAVEALGKMLEPSSKGKR